MSLKPIFDRLLVKEIKNPSVIVLPEEGSEELKPIYAKVISHGQGMFTIGGHYKPVETKPGDTVLFNRAAGVKIKHKGEEFYILREEGILCVVEDEQNESNTSA